MKSILTIVAVVALMAGAAFVITQKVIKPRFAAAARVEAAVPKETKTEAKEERGEVYMVPNLLVNPNGTAGTRYLSTTVGLETRAKETAAKLRERDVQVRDLLIAILSARTVEQLTDTRARDEMRAEILARLNALLGGQELSAVYFVDYVLQ